MNDDDLLELYLQGYNLTEAEQYLSQLYSNTKPIQVVGLLVTIN